LTSDRHARLLGGEHVLMSYALGSGAQVPFTELGDHLLADSPNWVHLDRFHSQTRPWLESAVGFLDPFVIDALLDEETRPRLLVVGDGAIIILRAVNHNPGAEPEDMVSLRMWIDAKRIISLQGRQIRALDDLVRALGGRNCPRNSGEFLTMLSDLLLDPLQPVLNEIEAEIDSAEESILDGPRPNLGKDLTEVRQTSIALRRYIAPQRDVFGQLQAAELSWLSPHDRRHLQETQNTVIRYVEDLDQIRDRSQVAKDELQAALTVKLTRNTFIFSVLTAVFLPLTFVTGLLGINVGGIPGAGSDAAFWTIAGILVLVMIAEVAVFRWLKWF
jgi:zinc transporter